MLKAKKFNFYRRLYKEDKGIWIKDKQGVSINN